ncbi:MAG: hypothetical protein FJ320_08600 [SAR202 cluster bacterium]|nr:hypothetical protein [SAR202 cluster bacterium]
MANKELRKHAQELSRVGASKGGYARAQKMTNEERRESARLAALTRWEKISPERSLLVATEKIPWAVAEGELGFLDRLIPCAVLDNGLRVLTQEGVLTALGRAGKAKGGEGASTGNLPAVLRARNLAPFITDEIREATRPIIYKPLLGGYSWAGGLRGIAYGCRSDALPMICKVYVDAENSGALIATQKHIAEAARRLSEALANVAMVALIDEATGYQSIRAHNELQRILEAYVLPEHRPWVRAVPIEFTKEIYRLWGWDLNADSTQGPRYAGKLIRKYIYEMLPKGVLGELDRRNPPNEKWQRPRKHHQFLTVEMGLEHFKAQLSGVMALMRASVDKHEFERLFRRAYDKAFQTELPLELDEPTRVVALPNPVSAV